MNKVPHKILEEQLALLEEENAELRTRNSKLSERIEILELNDDVIIVFDSVGKYLQMSEPKKSMQYKPIKNIINQNVNEILPKNEANIFKKAITESLNKNQKINISYSIELENKILWYDGRLIPLYQNHVLFVGRDITKYKQKEFALIDSEFKHKAIFENTSHAFLLINRLNQVEAYNKKLELLSKKILEIPFNKNALIKRIRQEDTRIGENIKKAFSSQRNSIEIKISLEKKNLWLELRFSPVKDINKQVIAVFISILNISKRKLTEKRLLKNKTNLKAMFDSSQRFFHLIDSDYKILSFNKLVKEYFEKIHNIELKEGVNIIDYIPERKVENFKASIQKALSGNKVVFEGWFVQNNKNVFWAEFLYLPVYNENNDILGVAYSILDISEKQDFITNIESKNKELNALNKTLATTNETLIENQDVIRNSKDAFEKIFKQSPDAIIIANKKGIISDCNDETLNLISEKDKSKIIGQSAFNFIGTNEKKKILHAFQNIHSETIIKDIEVTIITKKNEKMYVEFSLSSIKGRDFGELHYIIILKNITQRKKAVLALRKSEKDLKETNISKDKFFSIIAHDLKNPFNNIMGFSELLLEDLNAYPKEKIREIISWINESSTQGYSLLENLLHWSRSQTGGLDWHPESVDLIKLINIEADLLKKTALKKGVNLTIPTQGRKMIFADKNMIKTVIRNLISNAIKFTKSSGSVEAKVEPCENSNFIKVAIIDSGIGMSDSALNDLFRIDTNSTTLGTDNETGTGLGLILCKEFIEKNGGKLKVKSKIDEGSTFYFGLPAEKILGDTRTVSLP